MHKQVSIFIETLMNIFSNFTPKKLVSFDDRDPLWICFFICQKKMGFTPCKTEQPLQGMELQEKKHKKDYRIQKICLERTYS